jgi:pyridoxine 4-dehydrogenase
MIQMSNTFTFTNGPTVKRLGYGTMQLPGKGVWGPAADPKAASDVILAAIDAGVNFIDTADSYGPFYANLYLRDALRKRPNANITVATKVGFTRQGPDQWVPLGAPQFLRQEVEMNLFTLGLDHIDLLQLHRIDANYPLEDQIGVLADMQKEGKIKQIGLSQVSVDQIKAAQKIAPIVSVQNRYNLIDRADEDVLQYATDNHLAFIPWFPLATGRLLKGDVLSTIAEAHDASPAQIALAWLLQKSQVILPIPGTKNADHARQNLAAENITLSTSDIAQLDKLGD